jgi:hypothetical protein
VTALIKPVSFLSFLSFMANLPLPNNTGAGARHRHRPSCRLDGGPVPSCLCPRCRAKNLVHNSKTFVETCLLVRHKACKLTLLLQSGSVLHNGLRDCKLRQAACIFERSRLWTIHPTPSTGRSQDPLLHSPYIPQTLDMQLQRLGGDGQAQARKFPLGPL